MKNYDELTSDLLERRDRYVTEQKKKRKRTTVAITAMCCFSLVVLSGFGIRKVSANNRPPITIDDSVTIGDKDYIGPDELDNNKTTNSDIQSSDKTDTENDESDKIALTINRVESQISASKLNFSADRYTCEKKTLTEIAGYLGKDLSKLESIISQDFEFIGNYETDFFYELDGKLVYDSCVFGYEKDEQLITIMVSKIGAPYDCIYVMDDPIISNISGVEVTVGGICKSDDPDEYDQIFADFSYNGLQYRVMLDNVLSDDGKCLYYIINELIK